MMYAGQSVGTRWPFVEHEGRSVLAQFKALTKGVLGLPLLQYLIGDLGQVQFVVLHTLPARRAGCDLYRPYFDTYAVGNMIAQANGTNWSTWSADPGSTEDAPISDAFAQSGTNSLAIIATAAGGGPTDLLLKLGDRTTGSYVLAFSVYIPTGKGGYLNVQHHEDVTPAAFNMEMIMPANGSVLATTTGVQDTLGTYPHDAWFTITMTFDMVNMEATMTVGTNPVYTWTTNTDTDGSVTLNQLGCIDFFAYGGGVDLGEMYVDDLSWTDVSSIGVPEALPVTIGAWPNPTTDAVNVSLSTPLSTQAEVRLLDVTGAVVDATTRISGSSIRVDLGTVPAGVYFLRITDGNHRSVERLVKK
jgi:hypothetical protein